MEKSDWQVEVIGLKEELRYVSMMSGALCVAGCGMQVMLLWSAGNLDIHPMVK